MEILIWKGKTIRTNNSNIVIPQFYLHNRNSYDEESFNQDFSVYQCKMTNVNLIYIKQVSGYTPYLSNINEENKNIVDSFDGCFSVQTHSPTEIVLPAKFTKISISASDLNNNYPPIEFCTLPVRGGKKGSRPFVLNLINTQIAMTMRKQNVVLQLW